MQTSEQIASEFQVIVGVEQLLEHESMSAHTSFKIGGPARYFVIPKNSEELAELLSLCAREELDFFVLGCGSNLLVSDDGYEGVVISTEGLAELTREGDVITCGAGVTLKALSNFACSEGLSGLEFACGIPGSVGGACFMNAGAYDGSISDVLLELTALNPNGELTSYSVDELAMGYRTSRVATDKLLVVAARFGLIGAPREEIQAKIDDLTARREEKQPLELPSAGSTFKRPEGYFAGKLIMDAGLQGYQSGGAAVSTKHAGFVVNLEHASAADVRAVIAHVREEVERQSGVLLEPELRFLGEFSDGLSF